MKVGDYYKNHFTGEFMQIAQIYMSDDTIILMPLNRDTIVMVRAMDLMRDWKFMSEGDVPARLGF